MNYEFQETVKVVSSEYLEFNAVDILNKEVIKFTKADQEIISTFCLQTCLYRKLHTLFTETELLSITEQVFTNELVRDFVLDVTDKLSVRLNMNQNHVIEKYLSNTLSSFETRQNITPGKILTPSRVLGNICIYADEILEVLTYNKWMVSIVLINLYFFDSDFFADEDSDKPSKDKSIKS